MIPNCKKEIKTKNELLDFFYPVGIYVETSDINFNPNESWGGVWVEDTEGQILMSRNTKYNSVGDDVGSNAKTLTIENLPAHSHTFTGKSHTHTIPAHAHGLNNHTHSIGAHAHGLNNHTHSIPALSGTASSAGAHAHYVTHGNNTEGTNRLFLNEKSGGPAHLHLSYTSARTDGTYIMAATNGSHTHSVTTTASTSGKASGNTANSTAFNSGKASGNTANSAELTSGGATQGGTIGNTGSGVAIDVVQNSKVCIRWHRVA